VNPVLILTRNNLALTKRCAESVWKQDIPTQLYIVDNGSHDGTVEWCEQNPVVFWSRAENEGVSSGWNTALNTIFNELFYEHCLCIGNDTVLEASAYATLLSYNEGFITGVAVNQMSQLTHGARMPLENHPDFSCFLITADVWEKVGPFDERMKLYASDCDFHIRAHRMGINLWKGCVPFYHERSSTLRLASPEEAAAINTQANKDREVFRSLYGCIPGDKAYESLFL